MVMGKILIGTSGYDYPEWKGVFYPVSIKRAEYLSYYAEQFNALELNFSYYTLPTAAQLSQMVKKTSGKVTFSIKGNQQFTHSIEIGKWKSTVKEFNESLYPLLNDNLLSSVLLQFPQSFHYEDETRIYLADLINEMQGIPLVVEFRHDSWQRQSVYDGLNQRGIGCCSSDMPEMSKLPTFKPIISGSSFYIRFHGRNKKNWYGTNSRDRYDYLYNDNELMAYKPILLNVEGQSKLIQIYFNNHAKGSAAVNARKMMLFLQE
jgi:uncharacterized protein YecE (DUF72 family)